MNVLEATDVTKTFREGSESVAVLKGAALTLDAARSWPWRAPRGRARRPS